MKRESGINNPVDRASTPATTELPGNLASAADSSQVCAVLKSQEKQQSNSGTEQFLSKCNIDLTEQTEHKGATLAETSGHESSDAGTRESELQAAGVNSPDLVGKELKEYFRSLAAEIQVNLVDPANFKIDTEGRGKITSSSKNENDEMLRQSSSALRQGDWTRQADSANPKDHRPPAQTTKGAPTDGKQKNERSPNSESPDAQTNRTIPTKLEVARGHNDLREALGKGAKLDRHDIGDTLTFPDGRKASVTKDQSGISVKETAVGESSNRQQILDPKDPFVRLKNGAILKFNESGQLDALSYKGKVYVFQRPGF